MRTDAEGDVAPSRVRPPSRAVQTALVVLATLLLTGLVSLSVLAWLEKSA